MPDINYPTGWIVADNFSAGFHRILIDWTLQGTAPGDAVLFFSEPERALTAVQPHLPGRQLRASGYSGSRGEHPARDLNQRWNDGGEMYDAVVCQAVLEHVCRPSVAVENLLRVLRAGGVLALHTHTPGFPYHPYPLDCCRFYPDFFHSLCKYVPAVVQEIRVLEGHLFAALRRT